MPTLTITFDYETDAQRLALEQTLAYLRQLNHTAVIANRGTVLDTCEKVVLEQGRAALRATLQAALDARVQNVDAAQKKSPARVPKADAPAGI
jgi:hypothetical protein